MVSVERLLVLREGELDHLVEESRAAGFDFLERFVREYRSGENRFENAGEAFFCARVDGGTVVGTGGLNLDPFAGDPSVGRVRRLYVAEAWRGQGIAAELTSTIIALARKSFRILQLRSTPLARGLYESLGFHPVNGDPQVTHRLVF
jgi:GNAT superfamily N-acetyltransferase